MINVANFFFIFPELIDLFPNDNVTPEIYQVWFNEQHQQQFNLMDVAEYRAAYVYVPVMGVTICYQHQLL